MAWFAGGRPDGPFHRRAPGYAVEVAGEALSYTARTAHDFGLVAWVGGSLFGRTALGPAIARVTSKAERGEVLTSAWRRWGMVDGVAVAAVSAGWLGARLGEARPANLTPREAAIARVKDELVIGSLLTSVASAILGARFSRQAPGGAVPVDSGAHSAPETPHRAARMQRIYQVLGPANLAAGLGVVAADAALAQEAFRRPAARRRLPFRG